MADALLGYDELGWLLRATGVERTLVIADTCNAGASVVIAGEGKVASVRTDYLAAIAAAVPGVRILASARADQRSFDGAFTSALLEATECATTDMCAGTTLFASDAEVFRVARELMVERWEGQQVPVSHGPLGDFPLARSQDVAPVGRVGIGPLEPFEDGSVSALITFAGRQLVRCRVRLSVIDHTGRILARDEGDGNIIPKRAVERRLVVLTARAVSRRAAAELHAHAACECPIRWRMEVLDTHGDAIASREDWLFVVRRRVA